MDSADIVRFLFLAGIAIVTYLWLLDKLAPSPSASRLQMEYGLRQQYPHSNESRRIRQTPHKGVTTDVVFVHGLGADPSRTWHYGETCWITDLLPEDLNKKGLESSVRLFTFDYDSFWVRNSNSTRLTITSESLRRELTNGEAYQHDLVLVGHSYGGLVIKQALVDSPDLKTRVKGVLFLGTPHRGTRFTRFGIMAASFLAPLDADVQIMRPLAADSVDLDDLEKKFSRLFHNTKRIYFFETRKMRRYLLGFIPCIREFVVPEHSATAGADDSQRIPLDTDHRSMNKFRDRNSNYRQVTRELLNVIEKSLAPPEAPYAPWAYSRSTAPCDTLIRVPGSQSNPAFSSLDGISQSNLLSQSPETMAQKQPTDVAASPYSFTLADDSARDHGFNPTERTTLRADDQWMVMGRTFRLTMSGSGWAAGLSYQHANGERFVVVLGIHNYSAWSAIATETGPEALQRDETTEDVINSYYSAGNPQVRRRDFGRYGVVKSLSGAKQVKLDVKAKLASSGHHLAEVSVA